jgi:hypothetical protein
MLKVDFEFRFRFWVAQRFTAAIESTKDKSGFSAWGMPSLII